MPDHPTFDLQRFVDAQAPVFDTVCAELAAGRKRTHWMWFVFPQLRGLGHSSMARHYGITCADEARAYRQHAVLGPRLLRCTQLVLQAPGTSATQIMGTPDDMKLRSSMSLFAATVPHEPAFSAVLQRFWQGRPDAATVALLAGG